MKRHFSIRLLTAILLLFTSALMVNSQVKTGIEVLRDRQFDVLAGLRVGLITNPTGVDQDLRSTVDILHEHVNLTALFGPEHGVRGNFSAGDHVGDRVDERTGIPVYSLYGAQRKPSPESLEQVDVLVYDLQDVGVRSYTYISTMGLVMEAAAEAGIKVVILDRPNPLGGNRIEGPLVQDGFHSFISRYKIPYVYGLTCGELALFLNGEGMLGNGLRCDLEVIRMEGWTREMSFDMTGLPWVPTSPHIPDETTAYLYPATGIIGELDPNMIGVGYTLPFAVMAGEELDAADLADAMNGLGMEGVLFRPIYFKPYYMAGKGQPMQGVQIHLNDPGKAVLTEIQFYFLQEAHRLNPSFNPFAGKESRYRMFDYGCGSDSLRQSMMKDFNFERIKDFWRKDADSFRERTKKYHLYP